MKGDRYCCICGAWLGNYQTGETPTGQASYYSIIKRKYCDTCNAWKRKQDNRFNQHEFQRRKKKMNKLKDERLQLYAEENKALRQIIRELREELEQTG